MDLSNNSIDKVDPVREKKQLNLSVELQDLGVSTQMKQPNVCDCNGKKLKDFRVLMLQKRGNFEITFT